MYTIYTDDTNRVSIICPKCGFELISLLKRDDILFKGFYIFSCGNDMGFLGRP